MLHIQWKITNKVADSVTCKTAERIENRAGRYVGEPGLIQVITRADVIGPEMET